MIRLGLLMLFGARGKYVMLITGIAFSTILMVQGMSLFCGLLSFSYATVDNVRSPVWVTDPIVAQVSDNQPLRDTELSRVRSVPGVAWAAPLFVGMVQARVIEYGVAKQMLLVGLDPTTFSGAPTGIIEGSLDDLRLPDTVMVDERARRLLSGDPSRPLRVGDVFEMNDRQARIAGICRAKMAFGGGAYVFTTYDRAVQYAPNQRKMLSFILVRPDAGRSDAEVVDAIRRSTGLRARTEDEFRTSTVWWTVRNSPIPVVVGLIVAIGFLVGSVIAGQTFYAFVAEHARYLGALRAMGAETVVLARMIVVQAACVGLVGYGIGLGAISAAFSAIPQGRVPLLMLWPVPLLALAAILVICVMAALLGIRQVARLEPAIVFRA